MSEQILLNRIRTPDGTILTSYYRHDYRTYVDSNGETYMVDGGTSYARRTIGQSTPYEELSVYLTDDHEANRQAFHWGSRGKLGDQPLSYRPLAELTVEHIEAIIETQKQIRGSFVLDLFIAELAFRKLGGPKTQEELIEQITEDVFAAHIKDEKKNELANEVLQELKDKEEASE